MVHVERFTRRGSLASCSSRAGPMCDSVGAAAAAQFAGLDLSIKLETRGFHLFFFQSRLS
tara:strand:- start:37 stop:216 length:180 start_codon:yes stop_codon:yes gene_type:complete